MIIMHASPLAQQLFFSFIFFTRTFVYNNIQLRGIDKEEKVEGKKLRHLVNSLNFLTSGLAEFEFSDGDPPPERVFVLAALYALQSV